MNYRNISMPLRISFLNLEGNPHNQAKSMKGSFRLLGCLTQDTVPYIGTVFFKKQDSYGKRLKRL
jgi:hypothetical protein